MTSILRILDEWITYPFITWCRPETEQSPEWFICCHGNVCFWGNSPLCQKLAHWNVSQQWTILAFWHTHCHANMHQLCSNHVLASHCPAVKFILVRLFCLSAVMSQYVYTRWSIQCSPGVMHTYNRKCNMLKSNNVDLDDNNINWENCKEIN
jgi:hypothetical protein